MVIQYSYTDNPEAGSGHREEMKFSVSYIKKREATELVQWMMALQAKSNNLISVLGNHVVRRKNKLL